MYKAIAISNATRQGFSNVSVAKTDAYVDNGRTINNNKLKEAKSKIEIIVGKKQTNANSEIYYAIHQSENKTFIMPDKINRILILISFYFNV